MDPTIVTPGLPSQLVTATNGFGAPVLFASAFVYATMLLFVKPFLESWAADRGKTEAQRSRLTLAATLFPGLIAALIVDFTPIALAFGVELHWAAAIPSGAIFYAAGGVLFHNVVKRIDPIGKIEEKVFGKSRGEMDDELQEKYEAATTRGERAITDADVKADREKRGL